MKKLVALLSLLLVISGCTATPSNENSSVYYEIFVSSFYDTNQDGVGDLNGVTSKLDYLQQLGVGGIWLMPIMPSPTYHKYDVVDYMSIDESYGTLEDFKALIAEAKQKDIDVIIDLVLNHTSSQHTWFLEAKQALLSNQCDSTKYCDYYNFSDQKISGSYPIGNQYYEAVFWDQMPDLNLDNPDVRNEIQEIVNFWLELGVSGFRLDATTHFYAGNATQNIEFLNWLNQTVSEIKEDAFIVGEAWSSESTIVDYYQSGIDAFFDFSLATQDGHLVKAIRNNDGIGLAKRVVEHNQAIQAHANSINAPFLSNHDNGRSGNYYTKLEQKKLAESIYLLLPGVPFIYYGEEIEMSGSGKDENKRLAMLWDDTKVGQCNQPSGYDYNKISQLTLETAMSDKQSLYSHIQQVIQIRNRYDFIEASIEVLELDPSLMGLVFTSGEDQWMVVHNLSSDNIEVSIQAEKILDKIEVNSPSSLKNNSLVIGGYSTILCK